MGERRRLWERLNLTILQLPFRDERGHKGWFERISRAQPHAVRQLAIEIDGWPRFERPLRIVFLSDFHAGSHSGDVARLTSIVAEAATFAPDLVLFGGDYINLSPLGGGRVPPHVVASILTQLNGTIGRFAILGNHDYVYDERAVAGALCDQGITVLDHERRSVTYRDHVLDVVGLPDAHGVRTKARELLANLPPLRPTIVMMHDPVSFADVPAGSILTLAGHTHGGQIKLPRIGAIINASKAPLRWSHGLIVDSGRHLYVTAGLGTSLLPIRIGVPPEFVVLDVNGSTGPSK